MKGFNTMKWANLFFAAIVIVFAPSAFASTTYVKINNFYQVPINHTNGRVFLYESEPDSMALFNLVQIYPNGVSTSVSRSQSTPGNRNYRIHRCRIQAYTFQEICTIDSSVNFFVYGTPNSPSLTLPSGTLTAGEEYTVLWGNVPHLAVPVGGKIFLEQKYENGDFTVVAEGTGAGQYTHGNPAAGTYTYRVRACNPGNLCSSYTEDTLSVVPANLPPGFTSGLDNVNEHVRNTLFTRVVRASDPNPANALTYDLSNATKALGATIAKIDNNSARISWTPSSDGLKTIEVTVTDNIAPAVQGSFTVNVIPPNNAPTVTASISGESSVVQGTEITISATARDIDDNLQQVKLCYSQDNNTDFCTLISDSCPTANATTGVDCSRNWTPPTPTPSTADITYYIWAVATDDEMAVAVSGISSIRVFPPNARPQVSMTSPNNGAVYNQGDTISLSADAVDSDGDIKDLQFFANGIAIGSKQTRTCSGTGQTRSFNYGWTVNVATTYNLTARVTDCEGEQSAISAPVPIEVRAITAPTVPSIRRFRENNQTITSSSTGNYLIEVSTVSGGTRYRLYENGALLPGELTAANPTKTVSNDSGTYQYCASAARVVNSIVRWSSVGTGSKCKSITVTLPRPPAPSFDAIDLQQTGNFALTWPVNSASTNYYKLHGKSGGVDSPEPWTELESNTTSLSYLVTNPDVGLYSYQLSACNAEGCEAGQQITINTLSPYIESAELGNCGADCLTISGIGFDGNAQIKVASISENRYLTPVTASVVNRENIQLTMTSEMLAAAGDLGVRLTVENPTQASSNLLFSTLASDSRPSLTDASVTVGNNGVIYATSGDQLLALNISDGNTVPGWPQTLDGISIAAPAINSVSGDIYVGTLNKQMHAYRPNGESLWKTQLRGAIRASAVIDETPMIYQGAMDSALYGIHPDGNIQWLYPLSAGVISKPSLYGNNLIYVTTEDTVTHKIDRGNLGPYALRWPNTDDAVMCDLPICMELFTRSWQPSQNEARGGELFTVGRLFYALLGRSPSERELTFWTYAYSNGATLQEVIDAFLLSSQGLERFPPTMPDHDFLRALFGNMFFSNWPETVNGLTFDDYLALLTDGATRAEVIRQMTNSLEYAGFVDNTLHQVFFYFYDFCILANGCVFAGDSDGDGISDEDEVANGLDPNNPFDGMLGTPIIQASEVDENNTFVLSWDPIASATVYQIQEAIGDGGFAILPEQPTEAMQELTKDPGNYRYRVRACISGTNNFLHCGANYSNVENVVVGQPIELTFDYPSADTAHPANEPLEAMLTTSLDASVARVTFVLDDGIDSISADVQSPYRFNFGLLELGMHTLDVHVLDDFGSTTSASIDFIVSDGASNPEIAPLPEVATALPNDNVSDLVGLTPGQFRVDESGAATYSIPIYAPEGFTGIKPELALNYHSSAGDGIMGIGWQVGGLSSITRCRQTYEQDGQPEGLTLTNNDRFCLDGQKLLMVDQAGTYGADGTEYRTELSSKTRVISYGQGGPEYFEVSREDGSTTWYGARDYEDAVRDDSVQRIGEVALSWLMNSNTDNTGNSISYTYFRNPVEDVSENELVIESISYSGNRIDFNYSSDARSNLSRRYVFGMPITNAGLLDNVVVTSHKDGGTVVRSYVINYEGTAAQFDRVEAIYECDGVTTFNAENCLRPTSFDWNDAPQIATLNNATTLDLADDKQLALSLPFDLDTDGFTDMVYVTKDGDLHTLYVAYNEDGTLAAPKRFNSFNLPDDIDARLIPLDINGDGIIELIFNERVGGQTIWRYVDVTSQREVCRTNYSDYAGDFCEWETVNYVVHNLGLTYDQTGKDLVVLDVNSDAYPDLLYVKNEEMYLVENNMAGFNAPDSVILNLFTNPDLPFSAFSSIRQLPVHLPPHDFNGDGVADLLVQMATNELDFEGSTSSHVTSYYWVAYELSRGADKYELNALTRIPFSDSLTANDSEDRIHVSDINGDGLGDVLHRNNDETSEWRLFYGTGDGFSEGETVNINIGFTNTRAEDIINIQYTDVNYDGRNDIVFFANVSTAGAWKYIPQTNDGFGSTRNMFGVNDYDKNRDQVLLGDWDGDGIVGSAKVNHEDQTLSYRKDAILNPTPPNRIHTITNGFGVKTQIEFGLMTDPEIYTKGQGAESLPDFGRCAMDNTLKCSPVFDVIAPSYLVSQVNSDAPRYSDDASTYLADAQVSVSYHYEALRIQSGGRGSLGFELVRTYDANKNITTTTQYGQNWPFVGMPRQTISYMGGRLQNDLTYDYEMSAFDTSVAENQRLSYSTSEFEYLEFGDRFFPFAAQNVENNYRVNSDNLSISELAVTTSISIAWSGLTGYPLMTSSETEIVDPDTGSSQSRLTENKYEQENEGNWWINRVTSTDVTYSETGKDPVTLSSEFAYEPDTGLISHSIVEPQGSCDQYLKTEYQYDGLGNKLSTATTSNESCSGHEVINRTRSVGFDVESRYPVTESNSYYTTQRYLARNALGLPTEMEGANGVWKKMQYGRFGEVFHTYSEVGDWQKLVRRWANDPSVPSIVPEYQYVEITTSATQAPNWAYFDKIGRKVADVTEDINSNRVYRYTRYDSLGNVLATSLPRQASVMADQDFIVNQFDIYDRAISTSSPNGKVVTVSFTGNATSSSVTFTRGSSITQTNSETLNAFGQTVRVVDNLDGEISYEYDVLGNLQTTFNHTDGSSIVTMHDKLSRKTRMDDPDKGANWTYTYNALGELLSQNNARSELSEYRYDNLGRKVREIMPGRMVTWEFTDQVAEHSEKGLIASASHTEGLDSTGYSYIYDAFGRKSEVTTTLNGIDFVSRTTYDQHGRTFQEFDASGDDRGLRYHYLNGYLHRIQEAREGVAGEYYLQNNQMNAFGDVTQFSQGNGIQTSKVYDSQSGFLTSIAASNGLGTIQNANYSYDALGNLLSRQRGTLQNNASQMVNGHAHNVQRQEFEYDPLNRLTKVNDQEQVRYHTNGNIAWKFDANNGQAAFYCYDSFRPHAVTGLRNADSDCGSSNDIIYDLNGNMTSDASRTITYSSYDKPLTIESSGESTAFSYGMDRNRFKRVDVADGITTTTYYVGNIEIVSRSDSEVVTYRRNLADAVHLYRSNGTSELTYLHKDHLGSLDTLTNENGEIKQKLYFDAWGKKVVLDQGLLKEHLQLIMTPLTLQQVLDITPRGFTGHEHVDHADIIHMNGRIYDPTLGRFLQADPHIQTPKNSQSYNRYTYVENNPLSYTDPSGFFIDKLFKGLNKLLGDLAPFVSIALTIWAPWGTGFWATVGTGFVAGGIATGSLRGALIGAFSAAAFYGVGEAFSQSNCSSCYVKNAGKLTDVLKTGARVGKIAAHAAVGGISSVLSGGKFGHGFASSGFTQAFAPGIDGIDKGSRFSAGRVIAAAVVGGTASTITGGKFANGALTGAFSRAYNDEINHSAPITEEGCDGCYPFGKEAQLEKELLVPDLILELHELYEGVQFNRAVGHTAEEYMAKRLRDSGYVVLERGVTLRVDGGIRYPDLTILNQNNQLLGFAEVKAGNARLIKRQIIRDRVIQTKGAMIITTPAPTILPPGPIGPTNVDLFRVLIPEN